MCTDRYGANANLPRRSPQGEGGPGTEVAGWVRHAVACDERGRGEVFGTQAPATGVYYSFGAAGWSAGRAAMHSHSTSHVGRQTGARK